VYTKPVVEVNNHSVLSKADRLYFRRNSVYITRLYRNKAEYNTKRKRLFIMHVPTLTKFPKSGNKKPDFGKAKKNANS